MEKRTLLFRAWDGKQMIKEGLFVFGRVIKKGKGWNFWDNVTPVDGWQNDRQKGNVIFGSDEPNYGITVREPVIMQFSGARDVDDFPIFEGDFLEFSQEGVALVIYELYGFAVEFEDGTTEALGLCRLNQCRIIGNYYENEQLRF